MDTEKYYNESYIKPIIKVGRIVLIGSMIYFFLPFLWTWFFKGIQPDWAKIGEATVLWAILNLPWWISDPFAYFPVQGITGQLFCTLAGNASNLRMPCAIGAQKACGVEPGTKEGSIVSTIAIATTAFVSIGILAIGVIAGQAILNALPDSVTNSLSLMLPALLGAVFAAFLDGNEILAVICMALSLITIHLTNSGVFGYSDIVWLIQMFIPIFGTIAIGMLMRKRQLKKSGESTKE